MPLPSMLVIRAHRTIIRPIKEADLSDLMEINGDDEVTKFLPYATWRTLDDASAWLARMEALATAGTGQQLVIERLSDRKVIGTVLLFKFDESSSRLELGYVLGKSYWRQGFAREAIHAVCSHAFEHLSIRRIEAEVNPQNIGSNGLLQDLGFVREGQLRKRWVTKGAVHDTYIYGSLVEEWQNGSNPA